MVLCGNKLDLNRYFFKYSDVNTDTATKFALDNNLYYFEVSALRNEGINKMLYTVISELPLFQGYNMKKEIIALELEKQNQPNLNISVLSDIKEEEIQEKAVKNVINVNNKEITVTKKKSKCC